MMAITVTSSASAPSSAAQILGGAAGTDSSAGGFADLLFSQLSSVVTGINLPQASTASLKDKASGEKEATDQGSLTATDPALAFLMGTPGIQAPIVTNNPPKLDTSTTDTASEGGLNSLLDSTAKKRGSDQSMPDATERSLLTAAKQSATDTTESAPSNQPGTGNNTFQNLLAGATSAPAGDKGRESLSLPANIAVETAAPQEAPALATAVGTPQAKLDTATTSKTEVATPLHSSTWSNDFASKVVWLAKNDQQQAHISINPPQLGPIQISLQVNGDQASATFGSANAEVRQAIESSLPQLKEMLSSAGINLGQADVGANFAQQNRETPYPSTNGNRLANETAILPGDGNSGASKLGAPTQRGNGLVDLFA